MTRISTNDTAWSIYSHTGKKIIHISLQMQKISYIPFQQSQWNYIYGHAHLSTKNETPFRMMIIVSTQNK